MNTRLTDYFILLAFATAVVLLPEVSYADAIGEVIKDGVCELVEAATGRVGKAIATLAVAFIGVGAFFGRASWGLVVTITVGIGIIFGARGIANAIAGQEGYYCGTDLLPGDPANIT